MFTFQQLSHLKFVILNGRLHKNLSFKQILNVIIFIIILCEISQVKFQLLHTKMFKKKMSKQHKQMIIAIIQINKSKTQK